MELGRLARLCDLRDAYGPGQLPPRGVGLNHDDLRCAQGCARLGGELSHGAAPNDNDALTVFERARRSARTPTARGSASAPASAPTAAGRGRQPRAGALRRGARPPSALKPIEPSCSHRFTRSWRHAQHFPQLMRPSTATRQPTKPWSTPLPVAVTSPQTSCPSTTGAALPVRGWACPTGMNSGPSRHSVVSVAQNPASVHAICTSPTAGGGEWRDIVHPDIEPPVPTDALHEGDPAPRKLLIARRSAPTPPRGGHRCSAGPAPFALSPPCRAHRPSPLGRARWGQSRYRQRRRRRGPR